MSSYTALSVILLGTLLCMSMCTAQAQLSNRVIVQFGTLDFSVNDTRSDPPQLDGASLAPDGFLRNLGLVIYEVDRNISLTPQEFCQDLLQDPSVLLCEVDQIIKLDQSTGSTNINAVPSTTDDALSGQLWALGAMDIPGLWKKGITGIKQVRVCVMDSGFDLTHPDLQQNIWTNPGEIPNNGVDDDKNGVVDDVNGASFLNGVTSNKVQDANGHGTLVSGIIGATANNGIGVAGVAWNVSIIMARFMDATGNGALTDAVSAYDYCLSVRAHIIHNSWGSAQFSQALTVAFQAVAAKDVPVITSAGNDGQNTDSQAHYPSGFSGTYPTVLSVASIAQSLKLSSFSNYGQKSVQLSAPGQAIQGLALGGGYTVESGTSFASPQVTGVAALLYSYLQNNRSINIDTQNLATLVTGAILNSTTAYPDSSQTSKTLHGYINGPGAFTALDKSLAATGGKTTAIGGAAGIVIGLVIGIVLTTVVAGLGFLAYQRHKRHR